MLPGLACVKSRIGFPTSLLTYSTAMVTVLESVPFIVTTTGIALPGATDPGT